ncbi:MAG: Gfo/Idh/MocA family protein, partial [Christensenellales bacterium]
IMSNTIFRVAIVGCGGIHHEHARALACLPGVVLTQVCDSKPERADASAALYGCRAVYDAKTVFESDEVDGVHICTPHYLHGPMAIEAMRCGKYALVEKPMAGNLAQAREMIAVSDSLGGRLGVIFQNRYLKAARRLRQIITGREMGELLGIRGTVAWKRTPEYYSDDWHGRWATECGGVMMNQAIHTLDILQWCTGRPATRVSGRISTDGLGEYIEVEDTAHIRIEFEGGLVGTFYATVAGSENEPVEIHARLEGGRLLYRSGWLYRWESDGRLTLLVAPERQAKGDKAYWGIGHRAQLEDYYRSVLGGTPIWLDGRQAISSLEIVRALYAASRSGQPVTLPWKGE